MAWLIKVNNFQRFMSDIVSLSLYGFGSVDSLLNMRIWEIEALKTTMKDPDIKEAFKLIKLHTLD